VGIASLCSELAPRRAKYLFLRLLVCIQVVVGSQDGASCAILSYRRSMPLYQQVSDAPTWLPSPLYISPCVRRIPFTTSATFRCRSGHGMSPPMVPRALSCSPACVENA
jgi:hypothetical protein